jgi:hypothetical protein
MEPWCPNGVTLQRRDVVTSFSVPRAATRGDPGSPGSPAVRVQPIMSGAARTLQAGGSREGAAGDVVVTVAGEWRRVVTR